MLISRNAPTKSRTNSNAALKKLRLSSLASVLGLRNHGAASAVAQSLQKNIALRGVNSTLLTMFPVVSETVTAYAWKNYLASEVVAQANLTAEMKTRLVADLLPMARFELTSEFSDTPANWASRVATSLDQVTVMSKNTLETFKTVSAVGLRQAEKTSVIKAVKDANKTRFDALATMKYNFSGVSQKAPVAVVTEKQIKERERIMKFYLNAHAELATQHQSVLYERVLKDSGNFEARRLVKRWETRSELRAPIFSNICKSTFGQLQPSEFTTGTRVVLEKRQTHLTAISPNAYTRVGTGGVVTGAPHMGHFGAQLEQIGRRTYAGQDLGTSATPRRMLSAIMRSRNFNIRRTFQFHSNFGTRSPNRVSHMTFMIREETRIMSMMTWDPALQNTHAKRFGLANKTLRDVVRVFDGFILNSNSLNTTAIQRLRTGMRKIRAVQRRKRWIFRRTKNHSWTNGFTAARSLQAPYNRRLRLAGRRSSVPGFLLVTPASFHRTRQSRIHYFRNQPYFKRRYRIYERREERRAGHGDEVYRKQSRAKASYGAFVGAFGAGLSIILNPIAQNGTSTRGVARKLLAKLREYRLFRQYTNHDISHGCRNGSKFRQLRTSLTQLRDRYFDHHFYKNTRATKLMERVNLQSNKKTSTPLSRAYTNLLYDTRVSDMLGKYKNSNWRQMLTLLKVEQEHHMGTIADSEQVANQQIELKADVKQVVSMMGATREVEFKDVPDLNSADLANKIEFKLGLRNRMRERDSSRFYPDWSNMIKKRSTTQLPMHYGVIASGAGDVRTGLGRFSATNVNYKAANRLSSNVPAGVKLPTTSPLNNRRFARNLRSLALLKTYNSKGAGFKARRAAKRSAAISAVLKSTALLDNLLLVLNNPKNLRPLTIADISMMVVRYVKPQLDKSQRITAAPMVQADYFAFKSRADAINPPRPSGTCYMPLVLLENATPH